MSGAIKFVIAALVGAGAVLGVGAIYIFVIAPTPVHSAAVARIDPLAQSEARAEARRNTELDTAMHQQCAGVLKIGGPKLLSGMCKQILGMK